MLFLYHAGPIVSTAPPFTSPARAFYERAVGPASIVYAGVGEVGDAVCFKALREWPEGGPERMLRSVGAGSPLIRLGNRHHMVAKAVAMVGNRCAFVSDAVDGIDMLDLIDLLGETGNLMPRRVTWEILSRTSAGLDAAHRGMRGAPLESPILHGDLKPSNLMISRDGELKITDFCTGYTAILSEGATAGSLKKGIVRYLAPERRDGGTLTTASDVYALGIIALELLRGRWLRRLHSQNPAHDRQLAESVAKVDDLQLRSENDERAARNLILRMLSFDPSSRPTAQEASETLRRLTDRISGPSLEAFTVAHVVPWIDREQPESQDVERAIRAHYLRPGDDLPKPTIADAALVTKADRYEMQWRNELETTAPVEHTFLGLEDHRATPPASPRPSAASTDQFEVLFDELGGGATRSVPSHDTNPEPAQPRPLATPAPSPKAPSGISTVGWIAIVAVCLTAFMLGFGLLVVAVIVAT